MTRLGGCRPHDPIPPKATREMVLDVRAADVGDPVLISDLECMSLAFPRVKELLQDCATVRPN